MKKLFDFILKYLHFFILLNTFFVLQTSYIGFNDKVLEIKQRQDELRSKIKEQTEKNKAINEFKKNLEISKERIKDVENKIVTVQRQLPNTIMDSEILEFFSKQANLINIKEISLGPLKEQNRDFYFSKEYEIKGLGTYLQFLVFFEKVSEGHRLFNVRSLKLVTNNSNQKGRFQLLNMDTVLEAFRYNPDFNANDVENSSEEKGDDKNKGEDKNKGNKDKKKT